MSAYLFLASLGVLFMADAWTTIYLLSRPGSKEGNKRVAGWIQRSGPRTALIGSKAVVLAYFWYIAASIPNAVWIALIAVYAGVVSWNVYRIYKKKTGAA